MKMFEAMALGLVVCLTIIVIAMFIGGESSMPSLWLVHAIRYFETATLRPLPKGGKLKVWGLLVSIVLYGIWFLYFLDAAIDGDIDLPHEEIDLEKLHRKGRGKQ